VSVGGNGVLVGVGVGVSVGGTPVAVGVGVGVFVGGKGVGVAVALGVGVGVIQLQGVLPYVINDINAPVPVTVPYVIQSLITCGPIP
jgi:hypothetical protein